MAQAQAIEKAVEVLLAGETEGVKWLAVSCPDGYQTFRRLPRAVTFEGATYQRSGFNSDTGRAYYRSPGLVAMGL